MWLKTDVNGVVMYEASDGQRLKEPDKKPDKCGWTKIDVDGKVMWESPEGERTY